MTPDPMVPQGNFEFGISRIMKSLNPMTHDK